MGRYAGNPNESAVNSSIYFICKLRAICFERRFKTVQADNELFKEFTFSCHKQETATVHALLKVIGVA